MNKQPPVTQPLENVAQFVNDARIEIFNGYMAEKKYRAAYNYARENNMTEYAKTALKAWGEKTLQENR